MFSENFVQILSFLSYAFQARIVAVRVNVVVLFAWRDCDASCCCCGTQCQYSHIVLSQLICHIEYVFDSLDISYEENDSCHLK